MESERQDTDAPESLVDEFPIFEREMMGINIFPSNVSLETESCQMHVPFVFGKGHKGPNPSVEQNKIAKGGGDAGEIKDLNLPVNENGQSEKYNKEYNPVTTCWRYENKMALNPTVTSEYSLSPNAQEPCGHRVGDSTSFEHFFATECVIEPDSSLIQVAEQEKPQINKDADQNIEDEKNNGNADHRQQSKLLMDKDIIDVNQVFRQKRYNLSLFRFSYRIREGRDEESTDDDETDKSWDSEEELCDMDCTISTHSQLAQHEDDDLNHRRGESCRLSEEELANIAAASPLGYAKANNDENRTSIDDAIIIFQKLHKFIPFPEESLLIYVDQQLSRINTDIHGFTKVNDVYVERAFYKNLTIDRAQLMNLEGDVKLFETGAWEDAKSQDFVKTCEEVKKIRNHVWDHWVPEQNAYRKYMDQMSISTNLKDFVQHSFPFLKQGEGRDYLAIMEIIVSFHLSHKNNNHVSIVNIGDGDNVVDGIYQDINTSRPVFTYTILDRSSTEETEKTYECTDGYLWSLEDMKNFKIMLEHSYIESKINSRLPTTFTGVDLVYQKITSNNNSNYNNSHVPETEYYNQCRQLYCTLTLVTLILKPGGSLVVNASHLAYDGFFSGLMYLLSLLFKRVAITKPVASLEDTEEVWIVAKSFVGENIKLYELIQKGNYFNLDQTFANPLYPLPEQVIPKEIKDSVMLCIKHRCQWVLRPNIRNLSLLHQLGDKDIENENSQLKSFTVFKWMNTIRMEDYIYGTLRD